MRARASRAEYGRRMTRVLDFIDAHLDAALELRVLAEVAHFSPFHFHRLFMAWVGQTLGDYLRQRRLEAGALQLADAPRMSVLEVALAVGFGSGEAFSRAFKLRFGCTPTEWRRDQDGAWALELGAIRHVWADRQARRRALTTVLADGAVDVRLLTLAPVQVARLRYVGPMGPGVGLFWRKQVYPWIEANRLVGYARYGIGLDDPNVTPAAQCRYDACVEISGAVPAGAVAATLPGGRYAVLRFNGSAATVTEAWGMLFGQWLPASGMQMDQRPCVEHYPPSLPLDQGEDFACELCMPVVAL